MHRRSSSVSPSRNMSRRLSTSSSQLKRTSSPNDYSSPVRAQPPSNPPEPPLTLLHSTTSRSLPRRTSESPEVRREKDDAPLRTTPMSTYNPRIPFSGMVHDIRARLPWYWSDWKDAWNYRVIPSTWFIFFANVLPGLAFSLDLIEATGQYGVQEVLLASFMAAFVASVFGGQPLLISGVTGPITVFNKTIFDIFRGRDDFNYLHFMGWVYLWGAILHWVAAPLNAVVCVKYFTRMFCDTFGFYVGAVYVQYGIQVVTRQFHQTSTASAFLGILLAIITLILPHYFDALARSGYGNKHIRRFFADYGMPITIVAISGMAYWGRFDPYVLEKDMTLPTTDHSFRPAGNREWLVRFWQLPGNYVGIAFPFGIVLFILFFFDANVSSLIAQDSEYPLKKPAAFHWDTFLLGVTTFIAGLLGVPAPNGLIPQAPMHTASLVVMGYDESGDHDSDSEEPERERGRDFSDVEEGRAPPLRPVKSRASSTALSRRVTQLSGQAREARQRRRADSERKKSMREVPVAVVEQRVSNLAQGCLCLVLMTKPLEHVLGLIPKGVMAGLFWYMGTDALLNSGVTAKMLYLVRDPHAISSSDPLNNVRKSRIILFTLIQLIAFGATFGITQTIAAIGFPVVIILLVPVRMFIVPHLPFTREELDILDGPVASPFTMESVGGKPYPPKYAS